MRLLVDTDVFCKLGVCHLLEDTVTALGFPLSECMRLPALSHMLRRGRLARELGQPRCSELLPLAARMPCAPAGDESWLTAMAEVPEIDPGEAQLLAVGTRKGYRVLTGDKRAVAAVATVPGLSSVLRGKVVCLEGALVRLCNAIGTTAVQERIGPALDLDVSLKICFGDRDVMSGLLSYQADLERRAAPGLLWRQVG